MGDNVMLNDFDLTEYLSKPQKDLENRLNDMKDTLKSLGGPELTNAFDIEKSVGNRIRLEAAKMQYRELDLGFLKIKNEVSEKSVQKLPRFGVYALYGKNQFHFLHVKQKDSNSGFKLYNNHILFDSKIPTCFTNHLAQDVFEGGCVRKYYEFYIDRIARTVYQYNKLERCEKNQDDRITTRYSASISTLIPDETKMLIEEAKSIFCDKELYIISEIKPDEWKSIIIHDPLVVGIVNDHAFLVDCFDLTKNENSALAWLK